MLRHVLACSLHAASRLQLANNATSAVPTCIPLEVLLLLTRRYNQRQDIPMFSLSVAHINLCNAVGDALRCDDMLTSNRVPRPRSQTAGTCAASRTRLKHFSSMCRKTNCLPWCLLRNPSPVRPHRSATEDAHFQRHITHHAAVYNLYHNHRSTVELTRCFLSLAQAVIIAMRPAQAKHWS
jgi:hypothetical protein